MRTRVLRLLVVAVATATVGLMGASPAAAEIPVVDEALFDQELHFETPPIVMAVAVPELAGNACVIQFTAKAYYSKPRFSYIIREGGSVESRPIGCADRDIRDNFTWSGVSDHGVGPLASTHSESSSSNASGTAISYTSVYQEVSAYSFPTDYHGFGSLIRWTDRVSIYFEGVGRLNFCADFEAIFPFAITGGWRACAG